MKPETRAHHHSLEGARPRGLQSSSSASCQSLPLKVPRDHGGPIRGAKAQTVPLASRGLQSYKAQLPTSGHWGQSCISLVAGTYLEGFCFPFIFGFLSISPHKLVNWMHLPNVSHLSCLNVCTFQKGEILEFLNPRCPWSSSRPKGLLQKAIKELDPHSHITAYSYKIFFKFQGFHKIPHHRSIDPTLRTSFNPVGLQIGEPRSHRV